MHTSEENKMEPEPTSRNNALQNTSQQYTVYSQFIVQSKRTLLGTLNIRVVVLCTIKKATFGDLDPTDSEQACDHL